MNVLLIQPAFKKSEQAFPLGLGYLGAVLKKSGHSVFGIDMSFSYLSDVLHLVDVRHIDLVGMSLTSFNFRNGLDVCRAVKAYKPSIHIVGGGPHATIFKEELMRHERDCLDYLIVGDGERAFVDLIEALEQNSSLAQVKNLVYFNQDKLVLNEFCDQENTLDELPYPARDIFPIFKYKGMFIKGEEYTQIVTSRGCDHYCSYCPQPALGKKWRGRSPENVVGEIEEVVRQFGIKEFHFEDANFLGGGSERIKELCRGIIEKDIKIRWQCPNGLPLEDFKDDRFLELMAQAGCYHICLGIESFDASLLSHFNRKTDLALTRRIVNSAHEFGIEVCGYFMIGFPGQSLESIQMDIKLSRKLELDFVHYSIFHLIPGSALYGDYQKALTEEGESASPIFMDSVNMDVLKRERLMASFLACTTPRVILYATNRFTDIRSFFRILRRAYGYIFDKDVSF